MRGMWRTGAAALPIAVTLGCGGPKTVIPPRINLTQHEVLGVIEFSTSSKGELGPLATRRFIEESRRDQGLVRIVELGSEEAVLHELGRQRLDRDAFRELGSRDDLTTIITGDLLVSDIRPAVRITPNLRDLGVAADVDATLTVQMVEAASGASIWSRSASVTMRVGEVSVLGGNDVVFDAEDPERAYGELVDALVWRVTEDFRARVR